MLKLSLRRDVGAIAPLAMLVLAALVAVNLTAPPAHAGEGVTPPPIVETPKPGRIAGHKPVVLKCCYLKIDMGVAYCKRRDTAAELAIAPECKQAICKMYIDGTEQLQNQHVYVRSSKYECK